MGQGCRGCVLRVAAGLAVVLAGAVVGVMVWLYRGIAPTAGNFDAPGLTAPVTIRFDDYQRPYVTAETLEDALYAQGWLHVSHRLWQMELFRRAGKGRLAELLGPALLPTDEELWRNGVPQLAQRLEENASLEMRLAIDAYVAGVNAALEAGVSRPPEFLLLRHRAAPWEPADIYALGALMAYQTSNNANNELLRLALFEAVGADRAQIFLPDEGSQPRFPFVVPRSDGPDPAPLVTALARREAIDAASQALFPSFALGSNGWAVSPARAAEGYALFAFDSHDNLSVPNLVYEVHLFFEGTRQLRGWSVAGLPGVINGFNEHIAWGFTTIGDSQDLFVEVRSEEDPLLFRDGDDWYPATVETIAIPVRGRDEPVQLEIIHTRNGPLIHEDPPIALRWAAQDLQGLGIDSLLQFNLARNWGEFNAALDAFPAPALAATYADTNGNIGARVAGLLPDRAHGEGLIPLPGDDPQFRWRGTVPPHELPALYNPPEGFVATANARFNAPGDGPLVSADNAPGYRIRRLQRVLGGRYDFTLEDMRRLQMDWYDGQAALLLPALLRALESDALDPLEAAARHALMDWQEAPIAEPDLAAPIIFQAWYRHLAIEVFQPALEPALFEQLFRSTYPLNHALDRLIFRESRSPWWREGQAPLVTAAFRNAVAEIRAAQGRDIAFWRLDNMHSVRLEHELGQAVPQLGWWFNLPSAPWGGSGATVGRARYRFDRAYDVRGAATVRVAGVMRPVPEMHGIMPGGQSGHPLSLHYGNQTDLWLAGDLLPIAATPDAVTGNLLVLTPQ